jgi:hypothetical protein
MQTFDGLSHGSWVTNWHLFLVLEKIIKELGSVLERSFRLLPIMSHIMSHVFNPLSSIAHASHRCADSAEDMCGKTVEAIEQLQN